MPRWVLYFMYFELSCQPAGKIKLIWTLNCWTEIDNSTNKEIPGNDNVYDLEFRWMLRRTVGEIPRYFDVGYTLWNHRCPETSPIIDGVGKVMSVTQPILPRVRRANPPEIVSEAVRRSWVSTLNAELKVKCVQ